MAWLGRIEQFTIRIERTILDDEWNFKFSTRQVQLFLFFISEEIEASKACIHIQTCDSNGVVMIP